MTYSSKDKRKHGNVIGLLPAGGQATRINPLPCSKEMYPIGFRQVDEDGSLRPKVVCHYLLEKMRLADITKAYIVLRNGKWDIPAYLGDGTILNMHLGYLIMHLPFGVPYTIDQAYPFIHNAKVAFGFPDILFKPDDAFVQLLNRQTETNADIILGLYHTDQPQKWDMVDMDADGRIRRILIKPCQSNLCYSWAIAVWTKVFTQFMHDYLSVIQETNKPNKHNNYVNNVSKQQELFVGDVFQAAIDNDLHVEGVIFPKSTCLDIGTPDDLVKAYRNFS